MSRLVDIVVAVVVLVAVAPLLLGVALVLRVVDGSPILFRQVRGGRGGRRFTAVKLRTMRNAYDDAGRPLPDAQRVTRLGRWLRATRIDELPQLVSIVAGDMTLIGPRPLPPAVLAQAADGGAARSRVRPGLTGWAQVNGNARLDDADKLALDAWYVAHRSLKLDLIILARTLGVIVRGESVDAEAIRRAHASGPDRRG